MEELQIGELTMQSCSKCSESRAPEGLGLRTQHRVTKISDQKSGDYTIQFVHCGTLRQLNYLLGSLREHDV